MAKRNDGSWIAYDLDGTLAYYENWKTNEWNIGLPILHMAERLKKDLREGQEVRILTARAGLTEARNDEGQAATEEYQKKQVALVEEWCLKHFRYK